jgi:hypothetical protein
LAANQLAQVRWLAVVQVQFRFLHPIVLVVGLVLVAAAVLGRWRQMAMVGVVGVEGGLQLQW